jgi:outer membrane protein
MPLLQRTLLTALLALLAATFALADDTSPSVLKLTLRQAKALAVEHQVTILAAREQVRESAARTAEARSRFLPSVDLRAFQIRQTENLRAMGFDFPGFPTMIGPFDTFDARIRLTQRVFDMTSFHELSASHDALKASQLQADATAQQVAGAAAMAYVEALRAQQAVTAAEANYALSASLLKLAQDQQAAGTATGVDVVRAQNVHARNTLALRQARSAVNETDTRLHRALGMPMDTPLQLDDSLQDSSGEVPALASSLDQAVAHRPELMALREVIAQRENERKAAGAASYPSISLAGDIGPSGVTPTHNDYRTYSFGVQVTLPLLEGGAITAREDVASSRLKQAELQLRDTTQQVEEDVRLSLIALETSIEQVQTSETSLALAERLMQQAEDRFQTGVADNLEVVDAQANLASARSTHIDALASRKMALINYELATGSLDYGINP